MISEIKFRIFDKENNEYCEEPDYRWMLSRNGKLYNSENDEWHVVGQRYIVEFISSIDESQRLEENTDKIKGFIINEIDCAETISGIKLTDKEEDLIGRVCIMLYKFIDNLPKSDKWGSFADADMGKKLTTWSDDKLLNKVKDEFAQSKHRWFIKKLFTKRMTLKYWLQTELRYYPKQFVIGIKNLIRWFPIIWKDRDWDHSFIYEIFKFKLKNQSKYISKRGIHADAWRDSRNMNICINLMQKLQDGFYEMEYMDYCENLIVSIPHKNNSGIETDSFELDIEEVSEHLDDYFKKYPLVHKQVMLYGFKGYRTTTKTGVALSMGRINHLRAKKLLYKIMEVELEGWWD